MTNREKKLIDYNNKYSHIPKDFKERLIYLYDELKIDDISSQRILDKKNQMLETLSYSNFFIVLYEEPDGAKRGRFRLVNRKNLANMAISNSNFVHVYSPNAHDDNVFMRRLVNSDDFNHLNSLINTPCNITISTFHKIPKYVKTEDVILCEIGLIRPPFYPDWDNIGKKYSDMFNENVWIDDDLVIDGSVHKYYSVLPRVEINISYLNMIYTKQMYDRIVSRKKYDDTMELKYFNMEDYNNGQYR